MTTTHYGRNHQGEIAQGESMISLDTQKSDGQESLIELAYSMEKKHVPIWFFLSEKGINIARHMYDEHQCFLGIQVTRRITIKEAVQYLYESCGMCDCGENI